MRLTSRREQILRLGDLELPASYFEEGEALLIEAASDAGIHLADPKWPEHVRKGAQKAYDEGYAIMARLCLAHDLALFEANDRDNAERLLARFPHDLIYIRGKGFLAWNGRYYDGERADPHAYRLTGETAKAIHEEVRFIRHSSPDEQEKLRDARHRFARTTGNHLPQARMLEQVSKKRSFSADELDRDPLRIVVNNGTLHFRKPTSDMLGDEPYITFEPTHDPAHLASQCIDADYIPDAPCPRWEAFLERTQPEPARRLFLQIFAGLCLTGLMDWQGLVIHFGGGSNGKSLYTETMSRIMGSSCVVVQPETFLGRTQRSGDKPSPDLERLLGKRCVHIHEYPRGEPLDEATIKRITGGERLVVRGLHKDPIEMEPRFKMAIVANDKPVIKGTSEGIWRRVNLVHWQVHIPPEERRPTSEMLAEFMAERSGILRWALDGFAIYLERGLHPPESVRAATAEYRDDSDPVGVFIRDCVSHVPGQRVGGAYMHECFGRWAAANGARGMSTQIFAAQMQQHGMSKIRSTGTWWVDVQLHDVPTPDLSDPHPPASAPGEGK